MGIKILKLRHKFTPLPEACRWCGVRRRDHGRQWVPGAKWHSWEAPTTEQIQARIQARQLERQTPMPDWFRPLHEGRRST